MSNFTIVNKKLLVMSISRLTNKIAKNLGLTQSSQCEDRFSTGEATPTINEEGYPIPPYDDPLY